MVQSPGTATKGVPRAWLCPRLVGPLVGLAVLALLALASAAVASPPQAFSATGTITAVAAAAKNNVVVDYTATITSTGTFTGTYVGGGHSNGHPDGRSEDHFTFTATGST